MDIGAYIFSLDGTHSPGQDFYVAGAGDDFTNTGGIYDPFRTVDRAMQVADSTVTVDGGHYDSFYLNLKEQYVNLNQLYVYDELIHHFASYYTLAPADIKNGYVLMPGFIETHSDFSNVALNVIGGPSQVYGSDYRVETGALYWKDYTFGNLLDTGDVLRMTYLGTLRIKAMNTLVLHSHYSNINLERAVFVSPSGSDSTVMGGDGTDSGGNGTFQRPYRTIGTALSNSTSGDSIVAMAGEYPLFKGKANRSLTVGIDKTCVTDGTRRFIEDFFAPRNFDIFRGTIYTNSLWDYTYSGASSVSAGSGFLSLIYDGSNTVSADSTFTFTRDFELSAEMRNAVAPVRFRVTGSDNTVGFAYHNGNYVNWVTTGGNTYSCHGTLNTDASTTERAIIVENIPLTNINIRDKFAPLSYIPEDPGDVAVNVVGGTPQNNKEDFVLNNAQIQWDGLGLDGELEVGDVLRVIYRDRTLSRPIRVNISLYGKRFTIKVADTVGPWTTILKRDMVGDYSGPWRTSFYMDQGDPDLDIYLQLEDTDLFALEDDDYLRVDTGYTYFGRGFVSKFLAIANSFDNTDKDRPYGFRTERKSIVLYKDKVVSNFAATKTYGTAPYLATFNNLSIGEPDMWFWDFGDGTNSSFQNPTHLYANPGTYTVSLAISGPNGSNTITKTNYLTVV